MASDRDPDPAQIPANPDRDRLLFVLWCLIAGAVGYLAARGGAVMTPTERAAAIAWHAIHTAQDIATHLAALPPRVPVVRVWRRRCRVARTRRGRARLSVWPATLRRARGQTAAHIVAAVEVAMAMAVRQCEVARLMALPPSRGEASWSSLGAGALSRHVTHE